MPPPPKDKALLWESLPPSSPHKAFRGGIGGVPLDFQGDSDALEMTNPPKIPRNFWGVSILHFKGVDP